ncbi:MAG TPA: hypothetical protein DIS78_09750 [Lachnospiraceae bacterium]|nr:hypothetical protein [Lachnospiraceae bacterium]
MTGLKILIRRKRGRYSVLGNDYVILYIEINVFALVLIGIIRYKTRGLTEMVAQKNFAMCIDSQMLFYISDTLYVMIKCGVLPHSTFFIMLTKELYFFATAVMCFFWFLYFEYIQDSPFVESRRRMRLSSALVWIMVALLLINPFNGMLFYVDADGIYRRGPLFIIQYVLSYLYIFTTSFRALKGVFDKGKQSKREMLIRLSVFPVLPACAGIGQFIYPQLPLACMVISLSTLVMYLQWIEQMISVDPLTRLNNRKQLAYYYEHTVQNMEDDAVYLLIIDVNKFKKINDMYGHIEGDEALMRVAEALRKGCAKYPYRANIARYGGDEFVILVKADNDEMVEELKGRINKELSRLNEKAGAPYELTISTGAARVVHDKDMHELINRADKLMYKEKNGEP